MNFTPLDLKRLNLHKAAQVKGPLIIFVSIILVGLLAALLTLFLKDIL